MSTDGDFETVEASREGSSADQGRADDSVARALRLVGPPDANSARDLE